jgi:hypothetical protein
MTTIEIQKPGYVHLLQTIGIPGLVTSKHGSGDAGLIKLAKLNKIALLYSNAAQVEANADLIFLHELLIKTLEQVSTVFEKNNITYTLFKTVKPFPTTPSDIDVLLPKADFIRAEKLLMSSGYTRTTHDAYSSTLEKDMIVDLQQQPSVSNLPYFPRDLLFENAIVKTINGFDVRTLNHETELLVIAAHSFYKEQMFTMNDYYAITMLSEQADLEKVLRLAKQAKILEALQIIIGITSQITECVYGENLKVSELNTILKGYSKGRIETMPIKFPFSLIVRLLILRASKDKEMLKKLFPAIVRIITPGQLSKLFAHATRRTY